MSNEEAFGVKQKAVSSSARAGFMSGDGTPWVNKIIGHGEEDPMQLLANDMNWRTHPAFQRGVVQGALEKIGWIQEVIVNKRTSEEWDAVGGRYEETVVDGHLRVLLAMNASQQSVPVKYVDLTPDEEYLALQILDPSSALAYADAEKLEELRSMTDVSKIDDEYLKQMLDKLAETHGFIDDAQPINLNDVDIDNNNEDDSKTMLSCPKCGFRFGVDL